MAPSIRQSLKKAKKEIQNELGSKGVRVEKNRDEIERMADVLEKDVNQIGSRKPSSTDLTEEIRQIETEEAGIPEAEEDSQESLEEEIHEMDGDEDIRQKQEQLMEELERLKEEKKEDPDSTVKERLDRLEDEIRELQEQIIEKDSEELGKINELIKRVERLEMRSTDDLERRLNQLETKITSVERPESLDGRLTELEDQLLLGGSFAQRVEQEVKRNIGYKNEDIDNLKSRLQDLESKSDAEDERMEKDVEEIKERINNLEAQQVANKQVLRAEIARETEESDREFNRVNQKVETLWEALDEEVASLETRIYDVEEENEELLDDMVVLSKLMKSELSNR